MRFEDHTHQSPVENRCISERTPRDGLSDSGTLGIRRLCDHVPTHEPAYDPKRPVQNVRYSVAVGGKADVNRTSRSGAFAEFERSMIRQRIRAGLRRAVEAGKQLGRPKIDPALEKRMQSQGQWCRTIAHACTQ